MALCFTAEYCSSKSINFKANFYVETKGKLFWSNYLEIQLKQI